MKPTLVRSFGLPSLHRMHVRRWSTDIRASIAILVLTTICVAGCNTQTTKQIVADIAAQISIAQAVVATTAAAGEGIDPAAASLIAAAADTAQAGLAQLQILCDAYAQSASSTVLASIGDALTTLLNTNAASLLNAAHIIDPASRAIAQTSLGALQTTLLLISAILQRSQSTSQIAATAASRTYKLRALAPFLDHDAVLQATGMPFEAALHLQEAQGF